MNDRHLTRREVLRRLGIGGAALTLPTSALLAADLSDR